MHLGYHCNGRHFEFWQSLNNCHTLRWIFLQSFMKFDERNQTKNWIPLFCFHGNCGKVCSTDSDFFGLSRSTRCGCYSYQVSSISVWRVTCYDHFCVFQFFWILAVSMATAAILKKNQPLKAQLHMAYDIPTRFHKVWSRHLREIERTKMCGRIRIIRIIVKKKRRITIHHPTAVRVM